jgi:hypothetical protein
MAQSPTDALKIVLQIVVPCGIAFVVTWINIKIKFATDAAQAIAEAKRILGIVANALLNAYILFVLGYQIARPDPDVHMFVLIIVFNSLALLCNLLTWIFRNVLTVAELQSERISQLVKLVRILSDNANAN